MSQTLFAMTDAQGENKHHQSSRVPSVMWRNDGIVNRMVSSIFRNCKGDKTDDDGRVGDIY